METEVSSGRIPLPIARNEFLEFHDPIITLLLAVSDEVEALEEPSEEIEAKITGLLRRTIVRRSPLGKTLNTAAKWQFWTLDRSRFVSSERSAQFRLRGYTFKLDATEELAPKNWLLRVKKYRANAGGFRWRTEIEHTLLCLHADAKTEAFSRLAVYLRARAYIQYLKYEHLRNAPR